MSSAGQWSPASFAPGGKASAESSYALVVTNNPIEHLAHFLKLCKNAKNIIVADGGANRIYDLHLNGADEQAAMPYAICGDLDSIRPEVLQHYRSKQVLIAEHRGQHATDLAKSIRCAIGHSPDRTDIAIFGSLGGRADQAFSQVHHLYLMAGEFYRAKEEGRMYLITADAIMFLLEVGLNTIDTPVRSGLFTHYVGIIPIGKPAKITTKGLEWDVTDWKTEFNRQVSTSNHIKAETVNVETNAVILFTMEFDFTES